MCNDLGCYSGNITLSDHYLRYSDRLSHKNVRLHQCYKIIIFLSKLGIILKIGILSCIIMNDTDARMFTVILINKMGEAERYNLSSAKLLSIVN